MDTERDMRKEGDLKTQETAVRRQRAGVTTAPRGEDARQTRRSREEAGGALPRVSGKARKWTRPSAAEVGRKPEVGVVNKRRSGDFTSEADGSGGR